MGNTNNIFVAFLGLLGVKHTQSFSGQYFNEHPHKYNLYGLSKMLSDYGIRNAATQIEDRETDLFNIECPFVAHAGGDFVVVHLTPTFSKGTGENPPASEELEGAVHFLRNGKKLTLPVSQFIQSWSGVVLLAETSPDSIEPDYNKHRKKDLLHIAQQLIPVLAGIFILGMTYINRSLFADLGISLLLSVNLTGIYICYLLVLKQLKIHSRYADKICTLFSQSDCNNVLESDAAKLWGIFGWSEIGLGYFAANIVILLFLPQLMIYLVLINILPLPFTVWSVWYQKFKAQQWCPLCMIVQVLLWAIFIINLVFGYIPLPVIASNEAIFSQFFNYWLMPIFNSQFIIVVCLYAIPVFALNLLFPKLSEGNQVGQLRQEINSIKASEEVFRTLLTQQPFYETGMSDSQILFGNPDAQLRITILTNPFCNPCAKMHARVANLLKETKENVCIQYIFSAFNESLEYANRCFIAIYMEKGKAAAWQLYSDWFERGKALKEAFFNDLHLDMSNPAIEVEFQKHASWKEKTLLRATPAITVNGYKLPDNYKIEDLRYFTEFNVDVK